MSGSKGVEIRNLRPEDKLFERGPWTQEDDDTLLGLPPGYSHANLLATAKYLNRSLKVCKRRHDELCDYDKTKRLWGPEGDKKLLELVREHGIKWVLISTKLCELGIYAKSFFCCKRYRELLSEEHKLKNNNTGNFRSSSNPIESLYKVNENLDELSLLLFGSLTDDSIFSDPLGLDMNS